MRALIFFGIALFLTACATQGELEYINTEGQYQTACATEYTWLPSVDKYAVEYTLSYCAKQAVKRGYRVLEESLLTIDTKIPPSPNGQPWTFETAKQLHRLNKLTDKEYGYIIAYIDLGLNKH